MKQELRIATHRDYKPLKISDLRFLVAVFWVMTLCSNVVGYHLEFMN